MAATPPRPPRRPVVGSRNPTARPRRVAGLRDDAVPDAPLDEASPVETPSDEPASPLSAQPDEASPVEPAPSDEVSPVEPAASARSSALGSLRTTVVLVVVLVLLAAVAAGESWYLWLRPDPTVSASRPVVTGQLAYQAAVEAASSDTEEILSTSYKNYDDQVTQATSKMTDSFAKEYRQTVGDIRGKFVADKTVLTVKVAAAGVVRASSTQVQALLFLNQYVQKKGEKTTATPYRALVTVVHTEHGWLVSDLETQ